MTLGYNDGYDDYFYSQGFAASPFDTLVSAGQQRAAQEIQRRTGIDPRQIPTSGKQVEQRLRQEVSQRTRQVRRQAEREAKKAGVRVAKEVVKKVGGPEAQKIVNDTLRNMKVPPGVASAIVIPREASPEAVRDAAIEGGMRYAESALQKEFGVPIRLPRKPSLKEIGKSITGLLPADAEEAIDLGVNIGIQAASGALASVIAGAAIGSTIPGLGTVIGIGMALGYQALKEEFKEKPPPGMRECTGRQLPCPQIPQLSPIELIPWSQEQQVTLSAAIAGEQSRRMCGWGPMITCDNALGTMAMNAFNIVAGSTGRGSARGYDKSTVKVMGYYSVLRMIQVYEKALPLRVSYVDTKAPKINVRGQSLLQVKKTPGRTGQDIGIILGWLRRRQSELAGLVALGSQIEKLPPRDIAQLRFKLLTELRNAGMQFALSPTPDNRQWLATLGQYMRRLGEREGAVLEERKRRQAEGQKLFQQRAQIPAEQKKHVLQQLQFLCGQDDQNACKEYRRIAAGGALTSAQLKQFGVKAPPTPPRPPSPRPTPPTRPAPRPPRPPSGGPEQKARAVGMALLADWLRKNPKQARCVTPNVREYVLNLFVAAHVKKTISVPAATQRIFAILQRPC